ncbi:cupredoxin domain-containing protein [Rhodocyclus tenuis]|uniref:Cupredoxin domain-containing protein n=2 Tax=Rhodocyclus TaxID=1064 RepID=A0A6L5JVG0_RHOTE|nr:cupredoxin domain-containing protein [Rhodocyclus gracilis]MQY50802.1 cupredoxin domain-containing protein [Rhodocyclus gracilis]MRD72800.1 cupredoxin domain-containing protein [Rhodocyclus gracilis]NJA87632.1 cupredoxin domain-containing protein [Rhodocyclus gracilis]
MNLYRALCFLNRPVIIAGLLLFAALAPVQAQEIPTFNLTIRAGHFVPDTLEVPAGSKFRLMIKNEGPGAEEFESIELKKEKVLAPGASSFLIFQPLKPGTYKFFGDFHPETAQGRIVAK